VVPEDIHTPPPHHEGLPEIPRGGGVKVIKFQGGGGFKEIFFWTVSKTIKQTLTYFLVLSVAVVKP